MAGRWLLAAVAATALTAAPAHADPVYTKQNCFSTLGTDGCTADAKLTQTSGVVPSPDGKNVYALNPSGVIVQYHRDAVSGALTRERCYSTNGASGACTAISQLLTVFDGRFSTDGQYLYVVEINTGGVISFKRDLSTGNLTFADCITVAAVTGCKPAVGAGPPARTIELDSLGKNVYVGTSGYGVGAADDGIAVFTRGANGTLTQPAAPNGCISDSGTAGSCVVWPALKGGTSQLAIPADGKFVYATGTNTHDLSILPRNTSTGVLTSAGAACISYNDADCTTSYPELITANIAAIPPDDQGKLYVGYQTGIVVFQRDQTTGTVAKLACYNGLGDKGCTALPGLGQSVAYQLAFSPDGADLAVAEFSAAGGAHGGLLFLKRDKTTGTLSELDGGRGCITRDGTGPCRTDATIGGAGIVHAAPGSPNMFYAGFYFDSTHNLVAGFRADNAPTCSPASATTPFGTPVALTLSCTDPDGDPFSLAVNVPPAHGGLGTIDSGSVTYSPFAGFAGTDTFGFQATSNGLSSDSATATVKVQEAPPPPQQPACVPTTEIPGNSIDEDCDHLDAPKPDPIVKIKVKSGIKVPKGYTRKQACSGKVYAFLYKGKKRIGVRNTKLDKHCHWRTTFKPRRSKVGTAKTLLVKWSFGGNRYLAAATFKKKVKVPQQA